MKFDLELTLWRKAPQASQGVSSYATALFDRATIERHAGYLPARTRAMVADAQQPVGALALLGDAERTLLLQSWNHTEAPYPQELCCISSSSSRSSVLPRHRP